MKLGTKANSHPLRVKLPALRFLLREDRGQIEGTNLRDEIKIILASFRAENNQGKRICFLLTAFEWSIQEHDTSN